MIGFRFRLEKVLRYRRRLVDLRSRDVAATELALAAVDDRIDVLRRRLAAESPPGGPRATVDVRARLALAAWYDRQEKALANLGEERLAALDAVARSRTELTGAWRDRSNDVVFALGGSASEPAGSWESL